MNSDNLIDKPVDKNIVVKHNALIEACYDLEILEQRIILFAIAKAKEKEYGNSNPFEEPIIFSIKEFGEFFKVENNALYESVKIAMDRLYNRTFNFQEPDNRGVWVKDTRWITEKGYQDGTGRLYISFSRKLVTLVSHLEKHFTKYYLEQIAPITSKYGIRLYELVIKWKSTGATPVLEINQFRLMLGVKEGEYSKWSNFKTRVFDTAVKQVNQHTDIIVDYDFQKMGRSIAGVSFGLTFKNEKVIKDVKLVDESNKNQIKPLTDSQIALFTSKLCKDGIFQSLYAKQGESMGHFRERVTKDLENPENIKEKYLDHLTRLNLKVQIKK